MTNPPMLFDAYIFDISRATDTVTLLTCRSDALADDCLDEEEKAEVCAAIEKRCAALNAIHVKPVNRVNRQS